MGLDITSWFSDPFLNYLKSYGYCPVRLPRSDIQPLQILLKKGKDLQRLGELLTVLQSGTNVDIPKIKRDIQAANISGQRTGNLKIGVGLSILGNIIGAMGGSFLGIDTGYKNVKNISFEFNDVLEDSIEIANLDTYLGDADVSPFSRYVADMLESDDIFVTTSTIKSKKFTVISTASDGAEVKISIPVIQSIVGSKVIVTAESETSSKIIYEGTIPLIFGFQAIRLFYENGVYTAFKPITGGVAIKALEYVSNDGTDRLMIDGPFANLGG